MIRLKRKLDIYQLENDLEIYINDFERKRIIDTLRHMSKEEQEQEINDLVQSGIAKFKRASM